MAEKKLPPIVSGGWPLAGHALEFSNNPDQLIRRGIQEHGDIFRLKLLNKNAVVLNGAKLHKFFYLETDKALNINDVYGMLEAAFGQVLFIASNESYENQRPLLQFVFSREKMASYVVAMQAETQRWLDSLGDSGEVNMTREMQVLAQNVAGHAFLGTNFRDELNQEFWQAYETLGRSLDPVLPPHWPLPKFKARDKAKKYIREIFQPIIAKRRANPEAYDDLVVQMLSTPQKDGSMMDDELITSLFMGLIFAGHETTAGQAAWLIYELCQNDQYQNRLRDEIASQIGYGTPITGGTLRNLKQTYWAIDETTRLHPSAPLQLRIAKQDIELEGLTIPAESLVMVHSAHHHFDEAIWSDPYTFDPDRWSPERKEGKNSYDIISFGGGRHKCTGMNFAKNEMAVILGLLLQQFELEALSEDVHTMMNVGAFRPSEIITRYKKKRIEAEDVEKDQQAVPV